MPMGVPTGSPPGRPFSASLETYPLRALSSGSVLGDGGFGELAAAVPSKEFWEGFPDGDGLPVSEAWTGDGDVLLRTANDYYVQITAPLDKPCFPGDTVQTH